MHDEQAKGPESTLEIVARCEAERKLLAIPSAILESAWRRESQIEAVIDALLCASYLGDPRSCVCARHVGEWSARIATVLPYSADPSFVRRVGVLGNLDPALLERLSETLPYAAYVEEFQAIRLDPSAKRRTISIIVAVADEFSSCIAPNEDGRSYSPKRVIAIMRAGADAQSTHIIEALAGLVGT